MMMRVIHISADYPDEFDPNKTPVIHRLVQGLDEQGISQLIFSLNRTPRFSCEFMSAHKNLVAVRYWGLPYGLLQLISLRRLAKNIFAKYGHEFKNDTVILAHKYAVEGVVAYFLAKLSGCRLVVASMGNSDLKMMRMKPHYAGLYREIARKADSLIFATPWSAIGVCEKLNSYSESFGKKSEVVPYISYDKVIPLAQKNANPFCFVSVFHFRAWKLKNIDRVIAAVMGLASSCFPEIRLDIVGSGSDDQVLAVANLIKKYSAQDHVFLLGSMTRSEIDAVLPSYSALILPSYPESFGLVYIEAIKSGIPVMCSRNAGLDGFFGNNFPGVIVPHDDVRKISEGIRDLIENADKYRERFSIISDDLRSFSREEIIRSYVSALNSIEY